MLPWALPWALPGTIPGILPRTQRGTLRGTIPRVLPRTHPRTIPRALQGTQGGAGQGALRGTLRGAHPRAMHRAMGGPRRIVHHPVFPPVRFPSGLPCCRVSSLILLILFPGSRSGMTGPRIGPRVTKETSNESAGSPSLNSRAHRLFEIGERPELPFPRIPMLCYRPRDANSWGCKQLDFLNAQC